MKKRNRARRHHRSADRFELWLISKAQFFGQEIPLRCFLKELPNWALKSMMVNDIHLVLAVIFFQSGWEDGVVSATDEELVHMCEVMKGAGMLETQRRLGFSRYAVDGDDHLRNKGELRIELNPAVEEFVTSRFGAHIDHDAIEPFVPELLAICAKTDWVDSHYED